MVRSMCGVDPDDRIRIVPAPRWLRLLWRGRFAAMALGGRILVRPDVLGSPTLGELLVHELVHVGQWRRMGVVRFLAEYLRSYLGFRVRGLAHLEAYRRIPLEVEAREATRLILDRSRRP